jgi:NAD(P)-dependent dehydrogenase (short-subunit alcohol dehydrogenase family)
MRSPAELFDLSGRRAVVTGASSGIGRRLALVLAAAGAEVLVVARREQRLVQLAQEHPALAARLHPAAVDLLSDGAAAAVAERADTVLGGCDIVVGAAGMSSGLAGSCAFDGALFERVLRLNVTQQAALTAALFPALAASGQGRVIHVASIYGLGAEQMGPLTPYVVSKHALVGLTRSQAVEWSAHGITVNALAPGHIPTEMTEARLQDPAYAGGLLPRYPLGRFGRLEELDTAVLFLASPASTFVTGIVLPVDGGWSCR